MGNAMWLNWKKWNKMPNWPDFSNSRFLILPNKCSRDGQEAVNRKKTKNKITLTSAPVHWVAQTSANLAYQIQFGWINPRLGASSWPEMTEVFKTRWQTLDGRHGDAGAAEGLGGERETKDEAPKWCAERSREPPWPPATIWTLIERPCSGLTFSISFVYGGGHLLAMWTSCSIYAH